MTTRTAGPVKAYADRDLYVHGLKDKGVQPRKSIATLNDVELYLLVEGLARFQATDPNDALSFYQIAGIHGQPYTPWPKTEWFNNVSLGKDEDGNYEGGFCTHNSILFLTWHRPYLALFESQLYQHVNNAAKGLPQAYVDAAVNFRLPYWDWADAGNAKGAVFPLSALSQQNPSKPPEGVKFGKNNPLYASPVPNGYPASIKEGTKYTASPTTRGAGVEERVKRAYEYYKWQAQQNASNLTERVGYLLRSYERFSSMSNNGWAVPDPRVSRTKFAERWGSLEDIHNVLHGSVGGTGGNMSGIDRAAFDPVFWLHHANIDRLYSIWQAVHEDSTNADTFVMDQTVPEGWGNITTRDGENQNKDSFLYPFQTENGWYTSNDVRRTEDFGYCYPETMTKKSKTELLKDLTALYPTAAEQLRASRRGQQDAGIGLLGQAHIMSKMVAMKAPATVETKEEILKEMPDSDVLLAKSWEPEKPLLKDILKDDKYQEWLVNIKAERHTLGGKFSVAFFLGPVDEAVENWSLAPTYVGSFNPLGQSYETGCANCQNQQADHLQITGQIPLTIALQQRYLARILPNMEEQTITTYLAENLHWKVELNGQVLQDRSQVAGLTVFVVTNEVSLPEDPSQPPIYAPDVVIHPAATTKLDGSGRGEGTGLVQNEIS